MHFRGAVVGFALGLQTKINFCCWRCEPRSTGELEFARRAMGGWRWLLIEDLLYTERCVWKDFHPILSMAQCSNWPNSSADPY